MSCSTTASIFAWNLVSVARASHVARARVRAAATAAGSDSSIRGRTDEGRSKRLEKKSRATWCDSSLPECCHTSEAELFTHEVFGAVQAVSVTKKIVHAFKSLRLYESDWQANLFCEDFNQVLEPPHAQRTRHPNAACPSRAHHGRHTPTSQHTRGSLRAAGSGHRHPSGEAGRKCFVATREARAAAARL